MAQDSYKTKMVVTNTPESFLTQPMSLPEINAQNDVVKKTEQALDLAINSFEKENLGMKLFSHSIQSLNLRKQMHILIFKRQQD